MLLGKPGIGKSILGCKIALDWSDITNKRTNASDAKPKGMESDQNTSTKDYQGSDPNPTLDKTSCQSINMIGGEPLNQSKSNNMTLDIPSDLYGDKAQDTPLSHSNDITQSELDFLQQFSLLFHIDLGRVKPNSILLDVISEQILVDQRQNKQSLIDYMQKYPRKIMFILDGWDKFNPAFCQDVTDIANGKSFPNATVLVTSCIRESTVIPIAVNATFMIKGFNLDQAKQFIEKIFQLVKLTASGEDLVKFVTDHHLWGVFSAPTMLMYLCLLYSTGLPLQDKVTDLFCSIIKLSLEKQELKNMKNPAADVKVTMRDYQKELLHLGKLAYLGLEKKKTMFSLEEAMKIGGEAILKVGLLHKVMPESSFSPSCLLKFGHKTIQEFLAAVYVCNEETEFGSYLRFIPIVYNDSTAFTQFYNHIDSLIKVYDSQLFVTFVCGLNVQYGQKLLNKIKYISDNGTHTTTAAQCPEFSYKGWQTDKPGVVELAYRQGIKASDVTPFIVQCCWEMAQSNKSAHNSLRVGFPYKPVSAIPVTDLKPIINMNSMNLCNLTQLIQTSKVVFSKGKHARIYNLSHNKENNQNITALLDHFAHSLTNETYINITNMKSDIPCKSLPRIFNTTCKVIDLKNVHLQPSDMLEVLHRLPQHLVVLYLTTVTLSGCEASLCEAVTRLISLRVLYLISLFLPCLYQEKLCVAVSGLTQLQQLNMLKTDISAASKALVSCLTELTQLTHLILDDTQLTEDMTRAVVGLLPSSPDLVMLSLRGLPVAGSVRGLKQRLPHMKSLRWLNVSDGGLDSQQQLEVFLSLPKSIQIIYANGNDTQNDIISLTQKLPSLPNLQYVWLSLSSVSADITQQLKAAFQRTGAVIFSSDYDIFKHGEKLNKIYKDIFLTAET